jgi:hypothetical protein
MPHPRRIGERFDDHPTLKIAFNALTDVNESSALKRKSGKAAENFCLKDKNVISLIAAFR